MPPLVRLFNFVLCEFVPTKGKKKLYIYTMYKKLLILKRIIMITSVLSRFFFILSWCLLYAFKPQCIWLPFLACVSDIGFFFFTLFFLLNITRTKSFFFFHRLLFLWVSTRKFAGFSFELAFEFSTMCQQF